MDHRIKCINKIYIFTFRSINADSSSSSSVTQSCPTLCDPMNRSTPGLPVHHQLPEFTQTHVLESVMPSSHLILCRPLLLLPPLADNRIKDLCDTWRRKNLLNRTWKAQRSIKMDYLSIKYIKYAENLVLKHSFKKIGIDWVLHKWPVNIWRDVQHC